MSDIVERLRAFHKSPTAMEAAAEIERLRAELAAERERCARELKERIDTRLNTLFAK